MDKEQEVQQKEADKQIALLKSLNRLEEFSTMRDWLIKPEIDLLEQRLEVQADDMPEAQLRADLKHYFKLKRLFYKVFEQIKDN